MTRIGRFTVVEPITEHGLTHRFLAVDGDEIVEIQDFSRAAAFSADEAAYEAEYALRVAPCDALPRVVERVGGQLIVEHVPAVSVIDLLPDAPTGVPLPLATRVVADLAGATALLHIKECLARRLDVDSARVTLDGRGFCALDWTVREQSLAVRQQSISRARVELMSRDTVRGKPRSPADDVFALGALLFLLVTGQPISGGATLMEVLEAIAHDRRRAARDLRRDLPDDIVAIIDDATHSDPAQRLRAAELAARLRAPGDRASWAPEHVATELRALAPRHVDAALARVRRARAVT